ncbi:MAG: hypothetical protein CMJ19_00395 [Phycisphaeraceae bacterium]|nr:hypothetical protein [Phycisphaeraceae bacterium]
MISLGRLIRIIRTDDTVDIFRGLLKVNSSKFFKVFSGVYSWLWDIARIQTERLIRSGSTSRKVDRPIDIN